MALHFIIEGVIDSNIRERIIQSAIVLFEKHGFHGVSVNEIIENAHTSKGGFYHHFSSKDELLYIMHDMFISYVLDKSANVIQTYRSPTEKLIAILAEFIKVFDLYKPHITVFYQESVYLKGPYEQQIKLKRKQFKQIISDIIVEGIKCREFRPSLDAHITTMAILGIVNWTYRWYNRDGEKSIEEISRLFIDFILEAVLCEKELRRDLNKALIQLTNRPTSRS